MVLEMGLNFEFSGVKAILFDCDGTLVDSEYAHYLGFKLALEEIGHEFIIEDYHQYVGISDLLVANVLADRIGQDCSLHIFEKKNSNYLQLCNSGLPPIEHTVNFLKSLAEEKERLGIKIGVCSAARKNEVLSHLRHLGVETLLDIILSGEDDLQEYSDPEGVNKPKPYIYLHAMKELNITPQECVVIEDSIPGVTAGVSAGCVTVAVPTDYTRRLDLSHAHLRLDSFEDVGIHDFFRMLGNIKS